MKKMLQGAARLLLLATFNAHLFNASAQGTTFTYQGRLNSGTNLANGSYDLAFTLYNTNTTGTALAGPVTNSAVAVTNGLFTTLVNFVPGVFTGGSNWLQIAVSTNGANSFSTLTPRQRLTPVPYAVFAETASNVSGTVSAAQLAGAVASANLSGIYGNAVTFNNAGDSFTGNGTGLVNLNASALNSGTVADALLSANVPLLNANQTFTGVNTFAGANQGLIVNGGPIGTNLFTGLGLQYNPGSGEAAIISSLNDNRSFLTFYTKQGPGVPPQQQMKIDRNGVVMIDDQANNNGVLNDGTTNGASLVFGGNSGEGIASQRTPGVNQFGLDFYTGRTRQMSILNNGNIGMGTTNPGTALQVIGTITATGFSGNGAGLTSLTIPASSITGSMIVNGTISNADLAANSITGDKIANGTISLADVAANTFWNTTGNAGANPTNGAFLGTTDNLPLEFHVNGARVLRLEPGGASALLGNGIPNGAPNVVGGSPANFVAPGVVGAVIAGGGATNYGGTAYPNSVAEDFTFIGAGHGNSIEPIAFDSFIGAGSGNSIQRNAYASFIGSGQGNSIQPVAANSFIGGGQQNSIQPNSGFSFLGGGVYNSIQANGGWSFLGGGYQNFIQPYVTESVLCGGHNNSIQTNSSQSFLGGGASNLIQTNAYNSFLGGGETNTIQPNADHSFLGGGSGNSIQQGASCSVLGGGFNNSIQTNAWNSFLGGGNYNSIQASATYSVVVGGSGNIIQTNSFLSFIGCGGGNIIQPNTRNSFIGSGAVNTIQANAGYSVLSGGSYNSIGLNSDHSTIAGGGNNVINANCNGATIAGGQQNGITNNNPNAFVAGGYGNQANGNCAFAAGNFATVANANSFVWSDGSATTTSTANQQFMARASGGVVFYSSSGTGSGVALAAGGGSWANLSDRNSKTDLAPVTGPEVLAKLAAVPISRWSYKTEPGVTHLGPMAQDFYAAFGVGEDNRHITTVDEEGVALAAIQGLNEKVESGKRKAETQIEQLVEENAALKVQLAELKVMVKNLTQAQSK